MTDDVLKIVYKIATEADWRAACLAGVYAGSYDDVRDGFIHLSTAAQLPGTAAKHFKGKPGLVLVAFETAALGAALKWEPSRGGELFPHLYEPLRTTLAMWTREMPLGDDGVPKLPAELN